MNERVNARNHGTARGSWTTTAAVLALLAACHSTPAIDEWRENPTTPPEPIEAASPVNRVERPIERAPADPPPVAATRSDIPRPPVVPAASPSSAVAADVARVEAPREGDPGTFVRAKEVPPKLIAERSLAPEYPLHARQKRLEGAVLLRITVSDQGNVSHVDVAGSSGYAILDDAAVEGVKGWLFEPGKRGLVAVEKTIEHSVRFKLSE